MIPRSASPARSRLAPMRWATM